MRQLFLLDNICSMHTSTVNKSYFIKDLACGPSLGLQNLMWPSGLKSLPTSGVQYIKISVYSIYWVGHSHAEPTPTHTEIRRYGASEPQCVYGYVRTDGIN